MYVVEWDSYVAPLGAEVTAELGPLVVHLDNRRRAAHVSLATLLQSERYHQLMASWKDWLGASVATDDLGADASAPIGGVAARRVAAANDRLVARGRGIGPDTPARPGSFKLDYALDGPVPWTSPACARAGTVHLGGTLAEMTAAELDVARDRHPERPYVIGVQPSLSTTPGHRPASTRSGPTATCPTARRWT